MHATVMSTQFRKYLRFGLIHYLRLWRAKARLGLCGDRVHIDSNVQLMRFPKGIHIENNVAIKEGARICACNPQAIVKIGENTTIGYHTFIFASENISVGKNCLIAPFVYLVDSDHEISRDKLINQQPNRTAAITIGDDVWVGSNVTILKGVRIGDGAVIGANSLVNADVESYTIVGGVPAKVIGKRS